MSWKKVLCLMMWCHLMRKVSVQANTLQRMVSWVYWSRLQAHSIWSVSVGIIKINPPCESVVCFFDHLG